MQTWQLHAEYHMAAFCQVQHHSKGLESERVQHQGRRGAKSALLPCVLAGLETAPRQRRQGCKAVDCELQRLAV